MSIYLRDIPLAEALSRLDTFLKKARLDGILGSEEIPLDENALGRTLYAPVWAKISSPHYHSAAMDGFALRSAATVGASPGAPRRLACPQEAIYVDTGDPIPQWSDAVVPIEDAELLDEAGKAQPETRQPLAIRIRAALPPWRHVRTLGEDMVASELVLPQGHVMRPMDLGAMAACGHTQVTVSRQPRVAVLPTGTELIPIGATISPGKIIEFNSLVLAGQVIGWGGKATRFPITPDSRERLRNTVADAAAVHDLILINAGSSAGSEDYTAGVIEALGEVLVHGIAVRPGHPVIIGYVRSSVRTVPVIGVPGYPVSAAMTGEILVEGLLARWLGRPPKAVDVIEAELTRKINSPAGDDEYLRVVAGRMGEKILAAPLSRGAGVITSLVRADGIAIIPRGTQGYNAGEKIKVRLYRSRSDLDKTIFAIGSHDMILDLMTQYLAMQDRRLISVNVGSQGGLVALRRGEAHLAGSHLLDPQTGTYNVSFLGQYLPDVAVRLVTLVYRQQGLMVRRGNPKHIETLSDLIKPGVTFVNRQRGAGTRVLLDYHLERNGISVENVTGYENEEYTHLGVAAAVASGRADCGMGIAAAARALELDFVPLYQERYDFVVPVEHAESELLMPLFDLLRDSSFQDKVKSMEGYDVRDMGKFVAYHS